MKAFEPVLSRLAVSREGHALFVNTLSFLEYVGARKILKSQRAESISIRLLGHVAEEIRHAQLLKKVALKLSGGLLDSYRDEHLLCGAAARKYFQDVDHLSERFDLHLNEAQKYGLTTLLVEERVLGIYPAYEPVLSSCGYPGVVKAILKDEDRHLQDVKRALEEDRELTPGALDGSLGRLRASEELAFGELCGAWVSQLVLPPDF